MSEVGGKRRPVGYKMNKGPGQHVDHMLECQVDEHYRGKSMTSADHREADYMVNHRANLQVLDGRANIQKGQDVKRWLNEKRR